jgi:hypothetical protein
MFFNVENNSAGYKFHAGMTVASTISGNVNIATKGSVAAASAHISNNCTIGGILNITGALATTAFYASKPWAGFHCIANLLPATVFPGFSQTGISLSRTVAGTYVFTIPAHPKGLQYMVFVQQQTASPVTAIAVYGTLVTSSTSLTVFSKTTASGLVDYNFYVDTVP